MKVHELKIHSDFFKATVDGARKFEVVKLSDNIRLGDQLILRENTIQGITDRYCIAKVTFIQPCYSAILQGYTIVSYMLLNVFNL